MEKTSEKSVGMIVCSLISLIRPRLFAQIDREWATPDIIKE